MFIFEPDPDLIASMEADETNVIAFPKLAKPDGSVNVDSDYVVAELPCDVEPNDGDAA